MKILLKIMRNDFQRLNWCEIIGFVRFFIYDYLLIVNKAAICYISSQITNEMIISAQRVFNDFHLLLYSTLGIPCLFRCVYVYVCAVSPRFRYAAENQWAQRKDEWNKFHMNESKCVVDLLMIMCVCWKREIKSGVCVKRRDREWKMP